MDSMIANFDAQTPEAIMARKTVPEKILERCRELGEGLGAGTAMGVF
jgi:hypothetical protein